MYGITAASSISVLDCTKCSNSLGGTCKLFLALSENNFKGNETKPATYVCYETNKPIDVIQSPDMPFI